MVFVSPVRADKARPEVFARPFEAPVSLIRAKLRISIEIIGFLATHNFQSIDRYHFAMRCFRAVPGGPRLTNTRGGNNEHDYP